MNSNYFVEASADRKFPAIVVYCLFWYSDSEAREVMPKFPFENGWGCCGNTDVVYLNDNFDLPIKLSLCYLSVVEETHYEIESEIDSEKLMKKLSDEKISDFKGFLIGLGPFGIVTLWLYGDKKSVILMELTAKKININLKDYYPLNKVPSLTSFCKSFLGKNDSIGNIGSEKFDVIKKKFKKAIRQYSYRFIFSFGNKNETPHHQSTEEDSLKDDLFEVQIMKTVLYDGTFDYESQNILLEYHNAGVPQKLSIQCMKGKDDFEFHSFFNNEVIDVFDRFYGAHPDTKSDFIIKIDAENNKYELALYRQGLKEPVVIPESAYQLIVFKNKFEDYRSENYNQPRGAWIW